MPIIHKTSNYNLFKIAKGNRPVNANYMIRSIETRDMLPEHPILVTKDMVVLDGQHRLAAAEFLKIPIYYVISGELDEDDIPTCQNQKSWTLDNFCNFHAEKNQDYRFLKEMQMKFNFGIPFLASSFHTSHKAEKFREGKFKLSYSQEEIKKLMNQLKEIVDVIRTYHKGTLLVNVMRALWKMMTDTNYIHEQFLDKLEKYPSHTTLAIKFHNMTEVYNRLIVDVYNRNNKDEKKNLKIIEFKPKLYKNPKYQQIRLC